MNPLKPLSRKLYKKINPSIGYFKPRDKRLNKLKSLIRKYDLISFDVFDTLILRE